MEYNVLCCDEEGKSLQIQAPGGIVCSFYLGTKPRIGDYYIFYGRALIVEEILEDYSKCYLREDKTYAKNKKD